MSRKRKFSEEHLIAQATQLFWEKGYSSTSLIDLTKNLEIGEGSFYATFKSKKNLFYKCFDFYLMQRGQQFHEILSTQSDVKRGLTSLFNVVIDEFLADQKMRGCFIANTCGELGSEDKVIQEKLVFYHSSMEHAMTSFLNSKPWPYKTSKKAFIGLILTFILGAKQQVKFDQDKKHYTKSFKEILKLLY